jgi:hypothetical protein
VHRGEVGHRRVVPGVVDEERRARKHRRLAERRRVRDRARGGDVGRQPDLREDAVPRGLDDGHHRRADIERACGQLRQTLERARAGCGGGRFRPRCARPRRPYAVEGAQGRESRRAGERGPAAHRVAEREGRVVRRGRVGGGCAGRGGASRCLCSVRHSTPPQRTPSGAPRYTPPRRRPRAPAHYRPPSGDRPTREIRHRGATVPRRDPRSGWSAPRKEGGPGSRCRSRRWPIHPRRDGRCGPASSAADGGRGQHCVGASAATTPRPRPARRVEVPPRLRRERDTRGRGPQVWSSVSPPHRGAVERAVTSSRANRTYVADASNAGEGLAGARAPGPPRGARRSTGGRP